MAESREAVTVFLWIAARGRRMAEWQADGSRTRLRRGLVRGANILREEATVWGGEVAEMAEALEKEPWDRGIFILAVSRAVLQAVKKAGKTGKARTRVLVRVMNEVRNRGKE